MKKFRRILICLLIFSILSSLFMTSVFAAEEETVTLDVSLTSVYGGRRAIATLTFDDSVYTTAELVQQMCEKYGMEATMMMWVTRIGASGTQYADAETWSALFAKGQLEPQNHTYSHMDLRSSTEAGVANQSEENFTQQLVTSNDILKEYFPEYDFISLAPAYGRLSSEASAVARANFYSIRGVSGAAIQTTNPSTEGGSGSWANLYSPGVTLKDSTEEEQWERLKGIIDNYVSAGGWYTPFIHRVGEGSGVEMSTALTDTFFAYLDTYQESGDLWVTKHSSAVKYIRERQNSTPSAYYKGGKVYVSVTMAEETADGLPLSTEVFNHPLTARVALPSDCAGVTYTFGGESRYAAAFKEGDVCYALVDVTTDGTETVADMVAGTPEKVQTSTPEGLHATIASANQENQKTEITLGASITTTEEIVIDAAGAEIVIDLGKNTLTLGAAVTVKNGSLTIHNGTLYTGARVSAFLIPEGATGASLTLKALTSNEEVNPQSPTFDFRGGTVLLENCSFCRTTNIASATKNLNFEFNGASNAWFSSVFRLRGDCNFTAKNSILETRTSSGVIKPNAHYFRGQFATDKDFVGTATFDNTALHGARVCGVLYGTGTVKFINGSKVIPQTFTYDTNEDKSVALVLGYDAINLVVENSTITGNWQAIVIPHATLSATPVITLKTGAVIAATNSTNNKTTTSAVFGGNAVVVNVEGDAALLGEKLFSASSSNISSASNLTYILKQEDKVYTGSGLSLNVSSGELVMMSNPANEEKVTYTSADGLFLAKCNGVAREVPYIYNATIASYYNFMSKTNTKTVAMTPTYLIGSDVVKITWNYIGGEGVEYWRRGDTPSTGTYEFTYNGNTYVASFENVGAANADVTYYATGVSGGPKLSANITLYAAIDFNVYLPITTSELTHINGVAVGELPTVSEGGVTYYKYAFSDLAPKDAYRSQKVTLTVSFDGGTPLTLERYVSILGYAKSVDIHGKNEEIAVVKAAMNYINETRKYFYETEEELSPITDYLGDYAPIWQGEENVLTLPDDLVVIRAIALNLDTTPGFVVAVDKNFSGKVTFGKWSSDKLFDSVIDIDGEAVEVKCALFDVPVYLLLDNFTVSAGDDSFLFNLDTYISTVASHEGYAAALADYAKCAHAYRDVKEDLYYTPSAEIVNKGGAEGVVSYVIDDNDKATATFANSLLSKHQNLTLSYAVRTKYLATLLTEEGEDGLLHYRQANDGSYLYTLNETNVAFWRDITLSERVEIINHTHTHAFWGTNDDGGEFKYLKSDGVTVSTSTQPVGSSSKEIYASAQILKDCFGDLDPKSTLTFVQAGIGVYTADKTVDGELIESYSKYFKQLTLDAIANDKLITSRKTFQVSDTASSKSKVVTKDSLVTDDGRANVNSYMIVSGNAGENIENWTAYIDHALEAGGWAPFCIHLIREETVNTHHILQSEADALFAYTASLGERVWVATYTDASLYFCEWSSADVTCEFKDGELTVTLTDEEDNELYDMALTVKVVIPPSFHGVAYVGDTALDVREAEDGTHYAYVDIVPDTGAVVITKN